MLIGLKQVSYRIGQQVLLDQVTFSLEARERVALLGRNGTGKSTLFRILMGQIQAEDGEVIRQEGIRLACLEQAVPESNDAQVFDVVCAGLGAVGASVATCKRFALCPPINAEEEQRYAQVQHDLAEHHAWHLESEVDQCLARFGLQGDQLFGSLSGGMKRKVMLARAFVGQPDVLLLDEPTNHLDIPGIENLEEQVRQFKGALILVSHDRAFMNKIATRVCDLDRGMLKSWSGGYAGYLKGKAEFLAAQEKANAQFDKKLAEEEVWIRRGIEARRTRNEGRVRALMSMRREFSERRQVIGKAQMQVQEAAKGGKIVAEIEEATLSLGTMKILDRFSNVILRGEKIGLIGPNGIGKTTALKVILGQLKPDSGSIKLGTRLEVAYFDQLRSQFNEDDTAVEIIGDGKEFITLDGQPRHVIGYLQDFLFTPDRARQPVRTLSGGERARLMLARLFCMPSNVMVLDEPTNDLDIETLELLEEKLADYQGTLVLVSHDREFLNQIVTRCLVFEGQGRIGDYVGGYDDWLRQRTSDPWQGAEQTTSKTSTKLQTKPDAATPVAESTAVSSATVASKGAKKLGYKEQRELDQLPALIESLENQQSELLARISDPNFYKQSNQTVQEVQNTLSNTQGQLNQAYARWEELESRGN